MLSIISGEELKDVDESVQRTSEGVIEFMKRVV